MLDHEEPRQLSEFLALSPEEVQITCSPVLQVQSRQSCATNQRPGRFEVCQDLENVDLQRVERSVHGCLSPALQQPVPEVSGPAEVFLQIGPQVSNLSKSHETEDVIRFRLPHHLSEQVGPDVTVGRAETILQLLDRHLRVPEEVRPTFRIDQEVTWSWVQYAHTDISLAHQLHWSPSPE